MKFLFVWPNNDSWGYKPVGLSLLSALAKRLGWETKLYDTTEIDFEYVSNTAALESAKVFKPVDIPFDMSKKKIDLRESFSKVFEEFKPDCVGVTVLSTQYKLAKDITKIARSLEKDIPIIWGNKYPTLSPEKSLLELDVDYVLVEEGLDAFPEFLTALAETGEAKNVKNIWTKKNGKVVKTDLRPLKHDLDDLPYLDWEIFDKRHFARPFDGKLYIGGDYMSNWGCPHHCSYCLNQYLHELYGDKYYMRRPSIDRSMEELAYLKKKWKFTFLKFPDEDFLMRPLDNLKEFAEKYKEQINIPFAIQTNPKTVIGERVKVLKEMGCATVSLGIETGNEYLRKEILNRSDSGNDVIKAFKMFKKFGIRTSSFIMLGLPFETRETYWETVMLNRMAEVQYPNISYLFPFEGTPIRDIAIKEGFFDPEGRDKDAILRRDVPSLHYDDLSEEELIEMRNVFVLYIKLPDSYKKYIRRSEKGDQMGKKLRKKLLTIFDNTVWANDGWYQDDGNREQYIDELENILNSTVVEEI